MREMGKMKLEKSQTRIQISNFKFERPVPQSTGHGFLSFFLY